MNGAPADSANPSADRIGRLHGGDIDTVYLSPAPFYHSAPLAFSTGMQRLGATVVLLDRFTPEGVLAAIERYRVATVQMVPTMFVRLLWMDTVERDAYDLSSLRTVIHAAAPCSIEVKHGTIDWLGPIIHEYYSSTESNGTTTITAEEWLRKPGSVGRVDRGSMHICDEAGEEVSLGRLASSISRAGAIRSPTGTTP